VDESVRPRLRGERWSAPFLRRIAVAGALGFVALVLGAAPAGAHSVGGVDASNYRTRVRAVTPNVDGIAVRAVDLGDRLQLSNTTEHDVIVVGYDEEPYLRVGPRGVFENQRSPATFLNRSRRNPAPAPASADPEAPPEWRRISDGSTVRWHDHRAHWMGDRDPPIVERARGDEHLIQRFEIPLQTNGETLRVRGDVWWIPGPSPWPWIAVAVGLAVAVVIGARSRWSASIVGGALAVALLCAVVHAVGAWDASTASTAQRASDALPTVAAIALGIAALVLLARRGMRAAAPLLVFAGLFLGIAIGLADLSALVKSQLPTTLSFGLDRLTIVVALGGGFGVAAGAAFHVASRRDTTEPAAPAATGSAQDARAAFEARNTVGR
jgi:hypothetical protein